MLIVFPVALYSQVIQDWVNRYNGPGNSFDIISELISDNQNNVYVYGSSVGENTLTDLTIVKYSSNGEQKWVMRYNGKGNSIDQINSASTDNSGNSYVTGFTTDSSMVTVFTTAKIDSSGNLLWIKTFSGTGFNYGSGQSISVDNSGNAVAAGFMRNLSGYFEIAVIKYSSGGNLLASEFYSGAVPGNSLPVSLKTDSFNNVIVAGTSAAISGSEDIVLLKFDSLLNLIDEDSFNGTANQNDKVSDIVVDQENNVFVCGSLFNTSYLSDYFIAMIDRLGIIQWSLNINGSGNSYDFANSISVNDSFVYVTGSGRSDTSLGSEDFLTIKLNKTGAIIWTSVYNGNSGGSDYGNAVATDYAGNVYTGGASDRGNNQMTYALLKYNSSGILQWVKNYSVAEIPEDFIYGLVIDTSGNIIVSGISIGINTDYDFATIKYSQLVNVNENSSEYPESFFLYQNYPNPFNPNTTIRFRIARSDYVSLKLYDMLGNQVSELINRKMNPGIYEKEFDGSNLPSGVYFYKLETAQFKDVKRMVLIK